MKYIYLILALLLISLTSAATVQNGHLAKEFFENFQKTSPGDPNDYSTWDINFQGSIGFEQNKNNKFHDISNGRNIYHFNTGGKELLSMSIYGNNRCLREMTQDSDPLNPINYGGYFQDGGRKDQRFSFHYPSALAANRKTFIVRAPDKVQQRDGSIADVNTNLDLFAQYFYPHYANFYDNDGLGLANNKFEASNWHFYWKIKDQWIDNDIRVIKVEDLGNNFKMITYADLPDSQRSGQRFMSGYYNGLRGNMAAFEGDLYTNTRAETRFYFTQYFHNRARFLKEDNFFDNDVFNDGINVIEICAMSFWYEDNEVEIKGYPDYAPQGTDFVQLVFPSNANYIFVPVTIKNTGLSNSIYSHFENTANGLPNFNPLANTEIDLFEDVNQNRMLDQLEIENNHIGQRTRSVAPGETLHAIARLNVDQLDSGVGDVGFSLQLYNPNDPMELKGGSLVIHYQKGGDQNVALQDVVRFSRAATSQPNQPPSGSLQVRANGNLIQNGATVQAGTTIEFDVSEITDPENHDIGHQIFFPEGHSRYIGSNPREYMPLKLGQNKFLYQASDGTARRYEEFTINVVQGDQRQPIAEIYTPFHDSTTFPVGVPAMFATYFNEENSHDPDGNNPTQFGYGIQSLRWDFGDGNSISNDPYPEHIYQTPGTYTVTLTITDDEGQTGSTTQSLTITGQNQPPVARLVAVEPENFMQYGVVEISAHTSTDPNGNDDILGYLWSFIGPDGEYTNKDHIILTSDNSKLVFNTYQAGTYQIFVSAFDKWGEKDSTSIEIEVPPWDGIIRGSTTGYFVTPGGFFRGHRTDVIKKGWTVFGGVNDVRFGEANGEYFTASAINILRLENDNVPQGTPAHLRDIFKHTLSHNNRPQFAQVQNVPAGNYQVDVYMYDEEHSSQGNRYALDFGGLIFDRTLSANPTFEDFHFQGILNHPGGELVIQGMGPRTQSPYTGLAGFTMQRTDLECTDNDNDGFGPGCPQSNDCNDNNPNIKPNQPEICGDGIDNNCNGNGDEVCPEEDTTPPTVTTLSSTSTSITITFNEPITSTSAQNIQNFQLSESIQSITIINPTTIQLTTTQHSEGEYTITIQNIQDLNANIMQPTTRSYTISDSTTCSLPPSPILHLSFNDATANDISGNNHHATINGPTYLPTGGLLGSGAYDFDGQNDFLSIQNHPDFNTFPNGITMSAWIYPRDAGQDGGSRVISKRTDDGGSDVYSMLTSRQRPYLRINGIDFYSSTLFQLNAWNHIVTIADRNTNQIYLNWKLNPSRKLQHSN